MVRKKTHYRYIINTTLRRPWANTGNLGQISGRILNKTGNIVYISRGVLSILPVIWPRCRSTAPWSNGRVNSETPFDVGSCSYYIPIVACLTYILMTYLTQMKHNLTNCSRKLNKHGSAHESKPTWRRPCTGIATAW